MTLSLYTNSLIIIFLALCSLTLSQNSHALTVNDVQESYNLSFDISYYEDKKGDLDLDAIMEKHASKQFLSGQTKVLNFGFTKSAYWFHINIENQDSLNTRWILEILYPLLEKV